MTRLPRDLDGDARAHFDSRLSIPHGLPATGNRQLAARHDPLRVGTLAGILGEVADHFEASRDEIIERLFG
jgi:hypothetical protein